MRGTYTATFLSRLADVFAKRRNAVALDVGKGFDLIVGTSTGGLIGAALVSGVSLDRVIKLYRERGSAIFEREVPSDGCMVVPDLLLRRKALERGERALRTALGELFGDETLRQVYARRGIALSVPAVDMTRHASWVFKTPHCPGTNFRDDAYRLVDVCLATTAAPIFRSLAAIDHPERASGEGFRVFADGGLWANNPVLVGILDALRTAPEDKQIQVFSLGTCPKPAGEEIAKSAVHRGLAEWRFGADAAVASIDAQESAYDYMAKMLVEHLRRPCEIVRFPREKIPGALLRHLGLDNTSSEASQALVNQALTDADHTNIACNDTKSNEGRLIRAVFEDMPITVT